MGFQDDFMRVPLVSRSSRLWHPLLHVFSLVSETPRSVRLQLVPPPSAPLHTRSASIRCRGFACHAPAASRLRATNQGTILRFATRWGRSEEHTSELQSRE